MVAVRCYACVSLLLAVATADLQDGQYAIRNVNSGLYLDVQGGSVESGANALQMGMPDAGHSQWHLRSTNGGASYTIQNAHSGMYLSTPASDTNVNGANVFVWSSKEQDESLWKLHSVSNSEGTAYSIENIGTGRYLSVAGASTTEGANVHLWNSPGTLESQWRFVNGELCHDAVVGDMCYNDTIWAKDYAIHTRPEWYPGLTDMSSFADFQAHLHNCFWGRCPMPCTSTALHSCQMIGRFWDSSSCEDAVAPNCSVPDDRPICKCREQVTWAMDYGINLHPEWYPSLSNQSSFQEFQARLFKGKQAGLETNDCPEPCCHDTIPGERCHEDATWAMLYGIDTPDVSHWYPSSLTNQSSFADFQAYLHLCYGNDRCREPCTRTHVLLDRNMSLHCSHMGGLV